MASIYDVDANELIEKASEELKKVDNIKPPAWAPFAKTGVHKERPPASKDWWYARTASVLRTVYRLGPIGVSKLRTKYGGKKNRGFRMEHFYKGSGNIARKILQQLEKAGFVKHVQVGVHKGRIITPQGKSFLDKLATQIHKRSKPEKEVKEEKAKEKPKEIKKTEPKKEAKKPETKQEDKAAKKEQGDRKAEAKKDIKETRKVEKETKKTEEKKQDTKKGTK